MANTTSGTYTFDKTFAIDDVIMESYERIGLVGSAGNQLRSARRSLNLLFSEWGNRGVHYWAVGSTNIDLIEGSATSANATAEGSGTYTFYRSSGPDKDAFVNVGDKIKEGDTICIIEAMKLFNEIESEISGKIVKVLADDNTPVEFDQPLFLVDPS